MSAPVARAVFPREGGRLGRARAGARSGFTLLEIAVVLAISGIGLTIGLLAFGDYFQRVAAERAAQVFAQDLTLARNWAVRSRERVVIRFVEASLWYQIEAPASGTEIARRRFGSSGDIDLSSVALDMDGDSLVFDARGIADLTGAGGALGTARFSSGSVSYTVSFNSMGASKIDRT